MQRDAGSYRDPSGYVFFRDGRVYRAVAERARTAYEAVRDNAAVRDAIRDGAIIGSRELPEREAAELAPDVAYVVEHDRVGFISYPFEWPFSLLKRAAAFHLELHLRLLDAGVTLTDATAYNVQFLGHRPVFIDLLSLRPYRDGELWHGHHQFMHQFVHPLLLNALARIPYNRWYRGNLDGIHRRDLVRCLPLRKRVSPRLFRQVIAPHLLESNHDVAASAGKGSAPPSRLEKGALVAMLRELLAWVGSLQPATVHATTWSDYQVSRTYTEAEVDDKHAAVAAFVREHAPGVLWDIGCNAGEFSELALGNGCARVIGFDADEGALHAACGRAVEHDLDFLPLSMDMLNPTAGCGWRGAERMGLLDRERPDAILALALIHHLVIGGNIPLADAVAWLVSLAPRGIIEFVGKADETVVRMLRLREDVFDDYTEDAFRECLSAHAGIVSRTEVSGSGRALYVFERRH